ncbi:MAG: hypothetical protein KF752_07360 [Pirellulaceae bacterium]|nr:hypothetical protein [Pirellulaceae bacterium]
MHDRSLHIRTWGLGGIVALGLVLFFGTIIAGAQSNSTAKNSSAQAIDGEPFGVLHIEIPLTSDWGDQLPQVVIRAEDDRLFYPVVSYRMQSVPLPVEDLPPPRVGRPGGLLDRARRIIRPGISRHQVPVSIQIDTLFHGQAALAVQILGDVQRSIQVPVKRDVPAEHQRHLKHWWTQYTQQAKTAVADLQVPQQIPRYLTSMLASRLGLTDVDLTAPIEAPPTEPSQLAETMQLLAGQQSLKDDAFRELLRQQDLPISDEFPLPPEPQWQRVPAPIVDGQVAVEPLAERVPADWFYLRFGSFSNYLWFQDLGGRFGGELSQAFSLNALNRGGTARVERMLAIGTSSIAKLFGDKVIQDMALCGSDFFVSDGASLGVLFQAANPALLKASLESDRRGLIANNSDASLQTVQMAGQSVSLLSTPDNRLRSFMVQDGQFLLVSTSRALVEQFVAVADKRPATQEAGASAGGEQATGAELSGAQVASLAASPMFRWVRSLMPVDNDYSVFGYLPPEFIQRLLSPQYQIELRRRLSAAARLELAEMAGLVASAEGLERLESVADLQSAGLLPVTFEHRADGAHVLRSQNGWLDSCRGARGSFLPIVDVPIGHVSTQEVQQYQGLADYYQQNWAYADPIFFGVRRFQGQTEVDQQFTIEAYIAPFHPGKYGWIAEQLAEASLVELALPADDIVSLQARVHGGKGDEQAYYLFGGLKDMLPPDQEETQGLIRSLRAFKSAPAYLGAWPKPDIVENLPLGIGSRLGKPDSSGYSRMIGGLWRWQDDQWSLLSFHKSILDRAVGQVKFKPSADMAQVRLRVANLDNTQLASWINRESWQQGWTASHANAHVMDLIHQQFKVPAGQCRQVTERLLDAQIQCPLGGQYQFQSQWTESEAESKASALDVDSTPLEQRITSGWWASSAWSSSTMAHGRPLPPEDYMAPWLQWFRGAQVHVTQLPSTLAVVGVVKTQLPPLVMQPAESPSKLLQPMPAMNIFELPMKLFGKQPAKDQQPAASEVQEF